MPNFPETHTCLKRGNVILDVIRSFTKRRSPFWKFTSESPRASVSVAVTFSTTRMSAQMWGDLTMPLGRSQPGTYMLKYIVFTLLLSSFSFCQGIMFSFEAMTNPGGFDYFLFLSKIAQEIVKRFNKIGPGV